MTNWKRRPSSVFTTQPQETIQAKYINRKSLHRRRSMPNSTYCGTHVHVERLCTNLLDRRGNWHHHHRTRTRGRQLEGHCWQQQQLEKRQQQQQHSPRTEWRSNVCASVRACVRAFNQGAGSDRIEKRIMKEEEEKKNSLGLSLE